MKSLVPYLRARLAERSSRVQLVVLVMLVLVVGGFVTLDDLNAFTAKAITAITVIGPLAGLLIPDSNRDVTAAASQDAAVGAAVEMATAAAEKAAGPEATQVARNVGALVDRLGL